MCACAGVFARVRANACVFMRGCVVRAWSGPRVPGCMRVCARALVCVMCMCMRILARMHARVCVCALMREYTCMCMWARTSACIIFEQIELQAKLLNYFLGSNKSNINQYVRAYKSSACCLIETTPTDRRGPTL